MPILQPRRISTEASATGGRIFKFQVPLSEQFSINATVHLEKGKPPVLKTRELGVSFVSLGSFEERKKTARVRAFSHGSIDLLLGELGEVYAAATILKALAESGEARLPESGYTVSLPCRIHESVAALPPHRFAWDFDPGVDEFLAAGRLPSRRLAYVIAELQENARYYLGGRVEAGRVPMGGGELLLPSAQFVFSGSSPKYGMPPIEILLDAAEAFVEKLRPTFNPGTIIVEGTAVFNFFGPGT